MATDQTPMARLSLVANTAVGGFGRLSRVRAAAAPASIEKLSPITRSGSSAMPAAARAATYPVRRPRALLA
ncbi:MAG: hypothetical protein R2742_07120 [Micropruina glycogenica]